MRGLTLLEVLVSITIMSILMAALYAAYTSNAEAIQMTRQGSQVYQVARIVLDRMTKDLESALIEVPFFGKKTNLGMIGKNHDIDGQPADRLDFTTLTHLALTEGSPQTDLCEVGYHLAEDPENEGLILFRRDDGIADDEFTKGGQTYELARVVTGLDITFYDSNDQEFDNWNTFEGEQEDMLPSLIRVRLTIKDQLGHEQTFVTSVHPALAGKKESRNQPMRTGKKDSRCQDLGFAET